MEYAFKITKVDNRNFWKGVLEVPLDFTGSRPFLVHGLITLIQCYFPNFIDLWIYLWIIWLKTFNFDHIGVPEVPLNFIGSESFLIYDLITLIQWYLSNFIDLWNYLWVIWHKTLNFDHIDVLEVPPNFVRSRPFLVPNFIMSSASKLQIVNLSICVDICGNFGINPAILTK